ncbi:MAG: SAM-dependent methyltransferase [Actinomycetia bacterium]|nr:SAM-dependent methyltransferase [Actinomycetes bacterium]
MASGAKYDAIGRTYTRTRIPDPRIAARITAKLGDARTVLNVGAGTGSYEPVDRAVVAVEPSATMLAQRPRGAAPAARAVAEALPFATATFDAAMATLTLHHWNDLEQGVAEMRRVATRQVVLFFEPSCSDDFWLYADYFPESGEVPSERAPGARRLAALFDVRSIESVPVPADCTDGFGAAYWNRPEAYLDPDVQAGISSFAQLDDATRTENTERLRCDLASGAWDTRYGYLRTLAEYDGGYRLLVAGS